jgi:F-type H+-transporting ATPase subunit alpha
VEKMVVLIFAGSNGLLDDIAVVKIHDFEEKLLEHMENMHVKILHKIKKERMIPDDTHEDLIKIITKFKQTFLR